MPKLKLTEWLVAALEGEGREVSYNDAQFPGLCVRVTPKGHKSYVLRYSHNGKQDKRVLGNADQMGIADSRNAAADYLAQIRAGHDPKEERCLTVLKGMFELAVEHGLIEYPPTMGAKRARVNQMERYLTIDELQRIGAAFDAMEADGHNRIPLDCLRALMLTGARKNEMAQLRWEAVDLDTMTVTLDDFKGVTQSERKAKTIPISSALGRILRRRQADRINEFVFPANKADGSDTTHIKNLFSSWGAALERAGVPHARIHDSRHTVASLALNQGVALTTISGILGHKNRQTTLRYAHLADGIVRAAVEDVSATVEAALNTPCEDHGIEKQNAHQATPASGVDGLDDAA